MQSFHIKAGLDLDQEGIQAQLAHVQEELASVEGTAKLNLDTSGVARGLKSAAVSQQQMVDRMRTNMGKFESTMRAGAMKQIQSAKQVAGAKAAIMKSARAASKTHVVTGGSHTSADTSPSISDVTPSADIGGTGSQANEIV